MLKHVNEINTTHTDVDFSDIELNIKDAAWPAPFPSQLEYSPLVRGTWNIVHTGMLIPEAHQIFICAAGCLRGVVLTAAEMNATDRFSTIEVQEEHLYDGSLEYLAIDGVTDILERLPYKPKAVLLFTNCLHHFAGCDLDMIYRELRNQHPDIDFTDCYMNPIMRKSGLTPDQLMRSRLYMLLHEREKNPNAVAIIGNDLATRKDSELYCFLKDNGYKIHEITACKNYEEYQEMAESSYYISYYPSAIAGGDMLAERLGGKHIPLNLSFDYAEIRASLELLDSILDTGQIHILPDFDAKVAECEAAISKTHELIGDREIVIDYTYCVRPLGLAKLLLSHGFNVTTIYTDGFNGPDRPDYDYLVSNHPELKILPTINVKMRYYTPKEESDCIAIGQKGAYFRNTPHFVNAVEGDGMFGYEAIKQTMTHIKDAFLTKKETKDLVGRKGLGCESCI